MKNTLLLIGILIAFLFGGYLSYYFFSPKENIIEKDSAILLEKVRKVCKLVTVEGNFLERYTETNIRPITVYIPFPTTFKFPKEASILVTGKVLVGYDMEKVNITTEIENKKVIIRNLPEASILAVDHEIKYENLTESFFNEFSKEDYTQLAKNAKEELKNQALEEKLLEKAKAEGNDLIAIIETIVTSSGWTLEVDGDYDVEELLK